MALKGDEPRPLFAFAGIWKRWNGPIKIDGPTVEIDTYSFMTTARYAIVASIEHDRMPVPLTSEDQFEAWLSGTPADAFDLMRSSPPEQLRIVQAGAEKWDLMEALAD